MDRSLLAGQNVIVQGITGSQGAFHTRSMLAYGTNIVAGTSPNKAGQTLEGIPVYKTIDDIRRDHPVDISVIFVPAPHAKGAILEAIASGVPLIVCITEGIPIHDMLLIRQQLIEGRSILIGPNCPGLLIPGGNKLGIIPADLAMPGSVGIVSRSGTLTYETMAGLTQRGIGQKYVIGIGGDPVRGTGFIECLELFEKDPEVTSVVMIGEIGGNDEHAAAEYIKNNVSKPVYAYIAGHSAPAGVQLGHAGAILGTHDESAAAKTRVLKKAGAVVSDTIVGLTRLVGGDSVATP